MPTFPSNDSQVLTLAQELRAGLSGSSGDFPSPPIDPTGLETLINDVITKMNSSVDAQANSKNATVAKDTSVQSLVDAMKSDLRYAEYEVAGDDAKLSQLGWGGKKPAEPITAPGQPNNFIAGNEGAGTIEFAWDIPGAGSGGPVESYRIERREQPAGGGEPGPWAQVENAYTTEITLLDQPRGVQLEYRLFAVNKGGDSIPSNTVAAVL